MHAREGASVRSISITFAIDNGQWVPLCVLLSLSTLGSAEDRLLYGFAECHFDRARAEEKAEAGIW